MGLVGTCYPNALGQRSREAISEYRSGGLSRSPGPSTGGKRPHLMMIGSRADGNAIWSRSGAVPSPKLR
jgi:hypothetical protein